MHLFQKLKKWTSVMMIKHPRKMVLTAIVLLNVLLVILAAVIISHLAPSSLEDRGLWASAFYTVSMILDAGCIEYVIVDVGHSGVAIIVSCLVIVIVGMITFTGCVIGYITTLISGMIDSANSNSRRLYTYNHTIILNWNNRASEIVNDLIYCEHPQQVVVLVPENKEQVEAEIANRLADTVAREEKELQACLAEMQRDGASWLARHQYAHSNRIRNKMTVIVREGDTFATKQLMDISLDRAKTIIILNRDEHISACRYASQEHREHREKGNSTTIKTLVLVAEITAAESSADNQKIIVEVEDPWTHALVNKVIRHKENLGKCNIVAVPVDRLLGQILSQFSIMPELNRVYNELFSNRGAEFYSIQADIAEVHDLSDYLKDHFHAVPLTRIQAKTGLNYYYMADKSADPEHRSNWTDPGVTVACNPKYWIPRRNVLILGHNSKTRALMDAFQAFRAEWNPTAEQHARLGTDGRDVLNIAVLDEEKSLERMNYYQDYPYVKTYDPVEIFDEDRIKDAINTFIDDEDGDTGILILSDDTVMAEDMDAQALTYLIYVQEVLAERRAAMGGKDTERVDIVVEILNPKNYDVVHSYSVDYVVISNRYISKLLMQIGEKQPLFEFYTDILTYDVPNREDYVSKELYIKRIGDYLSDVDENWNLQCSAASLIRAVYRASIDLSEQLGADHTALVLGYIDEKTRKMVIFSGDQTKCKVDLHADDKLIVFSNH